MFPTVWSESFIFSQITKIVNMKMLPEFKDKQFTNRAYKIFSIIKSGFVAVIKVVFDRYTEKIITGYPLNGAVKL